MIVTAPPARLGPRLRAVLQMCPAEGPVAVVVAEPVIDPLELVEIHHQEAEAAPEA